MKKLANILVFSLALSVISFSYTAPVYAEDPFGIGTLNLDTSVSGAQGVDTNSMNISDAQGIQKTGTTQTSKKTYGSGSDSLPPPTQFTDLRTLLNAVLNVIVQIGLPVITLAFVWSGFQYVWARGSNDVEKVHKQLWWTVVGAAIVLGAKVLALGIEATINSLK